jgi:UDP-N-acetylmuramate-alanine ligase
MIDLFYFNGLPVAVLGLGTSGLAAARALMASGGEVWAWDDNEDRRAAAAAEGVPLVDLLHCNWRELTSLVLSPGIPHTHPEPHPVAALARQHDCEIIGDIELLGRAMRDVSYLGVTGTNGKSTTTALIGHLLEGAGRETQVGGNLGPAVLEMEPLGEGGFYVLEMSSYQLELTVSITSDVAVLLNVAPDHLDRQSASTTRSARASAASWPRPASRSWCPSPARTGRAAVSSPATASSTTTPRGRKAPYWICARCPACPAPTTGRTPPPPMPRPAPSAWSRW